MDISGEICRTTGFYRCNVHPSNLINIQAGTKFPECAHGCYGKHSTLWNPARNVRAIMAELKAECMQVSA
jgi:hypothetical protein